LGGIPAKYVLYAFRATEEELRSRSTGTTFDAIRGDDLRSHSIPLAPLTKQHRIVAEIEKHLTRLDDAVASLHRARANLKRYRTSVLKAACEGRLVPTEAELARREGRDYEPASTLLERILKERLARWEGQEKRRGKYREPRPPDTSNLPPLPEGWTWASLSQISEMQGGIQKHPKRAPRENSCPFLRVANVLRGHLDLSEVHEIELLAGELEKLRLQTGDLLIVEGNGSPTEIGRMAIWNGEIGDCVHQNHIIRARMLGGVISEYCEAYWNSPNGASRVLEVASSTSGLYTLSVSKVGRLPVPLPPLLEQRRIVAEVERHMSVIKAAEATVEANLKRTERLRQAILGRAFDGKLVPQDPTDEPASVLLERIRAEREHAGKSVSEVRRRAGGRRKAQGVSA
jgi:type I restriction enzyme S subunit